MSGLICHGQVSSLINSTSLPAKPRNRLLAMNYRSVSALNRSVSDWIERMPRDWDLVVGIPRSGLLVANLLALHLNLPLADLDGYLAGRVLSSGRRLAERTRQPVRKVLVVDDSVNTGGQIKQARQRINAASIGDKVSYAAAYVTSGAESQVDYYSEVIGSPRVFEWNLMHHSILLSSCLDIDGVLCRDPLETENDDGLQYARFLEKAEPRFLPSVPVGWLVTSRLEKYREPTEAWMKAHGINYRELIMLDLASKKERLRSGSHASHKSAAYLRTNADLFIESSLIQALEIAVLSGKPVYCVETSELVSPGDRGVSSATGTEAPLTGRIANTSPAVQPDPANWTDKLQLAVHEILGVIESGASFILIDAEQLGLHRVFAGRHAIPFPQQDGVYAGPPPDSKSAVQAFDTLMQERLIDYVVVAWPAFWWMEYYESFFSTLRSRYSTVMENSRLIIFDLSKGAK